MLAQAGQDGPDQPLSATKLGDTGVPRLSCLCVTEDRAPFMPWLLWNFERQTWASKELVVIDSSDRPLVAERPDVRVISLPRGTSIPAKRNRALSEARGEYLAWLDDDDWQHPERLEHLARSLEAGTADLAGCTSAWFLDLWKGRCAPYHPAGALIFNSCVARADVAKRVAFDEQQRRASDTPWMSSLSRRAWGRVTCVPRRTYALWLCHDTNVSNPRTQRRCVLPLDVLRNAVGVEAWGSTDDELERLRARISLQQPIE